MRHQEFIYPPANECPARMADAVRDVRFLRDDVDTRKLLRECWGTLEFFLMAVEAVYSSNEWALDRKEKARFRRIFRGQTS
jgi:hypothetical protein